jgi:hypothetical protein
MVHDRPMISFKADFVNWMHQPSQFTKLEKKNEEGISMPC